MQSDGENNNTPDIIAVARRVAAAIEGVEGEYFIGGSVASSFQGEPRTTNDIDIVFSIPLGHINAFVAALGSDFEVDVSMLRDALLHGRTCNIFFLPVLMKIDLFAIGPDPYDDMEFSRRRRIVGGDADSLFIKSAEDTVLRKLLWYREGGGISDRQWRDVVEVLRVSGATMDPAYLRDWAGRLKLTSLLDRAIGDATIVFKSEDH